VYVWYWRRSSSATTKQDINIINIELHTWIYLFFIPHCGKATAWMANTGQSATHAWCVLKYMISHMETELCTLFRCKPSSSVCQRNIPTNCSLICTTAYLRVRPITSRYGTNRCSERSCAMDAQSLHGLSTTAELLVYQKHRMAGKGGHRWRMDGLGGLLSSASSFHDDLLNQDTRLDYKYSIIKCGSEMNSRKRQHYIFTSVWA